MPGSIAPAGGSIYIKFTTRAFATGIPTVLSSSPVVSVYKDDNTSEVTTGVTLTANFDSRAGLNHVTIDTSSDGTFYANGHKFYLVITTGTVDGVSVVNEVVGEFELAAAAITAGNTLAVDASGRVDVGKILGTASQGAAGYVGIDWGQVTNKTTTNALTGTTIATSQVVASVTGAVGSVTGAVGSVTGNVGGNVVGTVASVVGAVGSVTGAVGSVTGNVGGNVTGTVGGMTAAGMALFFTVDTTKVYADAVAGSVIKEISTGSSTSVTVNGFTTTALAAFFAEDSGETYADSVSGSVVKEIADNAKVSPSNFAG